MHTRVITVPKTMEAEKALDYNQAKDHELIEYYINEEEFESLFEFDIINIINKTTNSNIDDFENEIVSGEENLLRVINVLQELELKFDKTGKNIVYQLKLLFEEALLRKTSVHFFL